MERGMAIGLGYPQPFQGSQEQREANFRTHRWERGHDARCFNCDCKAGSATSFWPCGTEPPRVLRDGTVRISVSPYDPVEVQAEAEEAEWGGL